MNKILLFIIDATAAITMYLMLMFLADKVMDKYAVNAPYIAFIVIYLGTGFITAIIIQAYKFILVEKYELNQKLDNKTSYIRTQEQYIRQLVAEKESLQDEFDELIQKYHETKKELDFYHDK